MNKSLEELAKEMREKMTTPSAMSAYEIATQIYGDETFADLAAQETIRAGWKFAGYDWNGDEVWTP